MKKIIDKQKGISQVLILVIMAVLAIALPLSTKLVQQIQENRSKAATPTSSDCYLGTTPAGFKIYVKNGFSTCTTSGSIFIGGITVSGANNSVFVPTSVLPWISTDNLVKCSNGKTTTTNCLTSSFHDKCVYTSNKKNLVVTATETSSNKTVLLSGVAARCGSNADCTNAGGSCNIPMKGATVGATCKTDAGVDGKVTSNLCWSVVKDSLNDYCCKPDKVNGKCGTANNACLSGTWSDVNDTTTQYKWNCEGKFGGTTANCSLSYSGGSTGTGSEGKPCRTVTSEHSTQCDSGLICNSSNICVKIKSCTSGSITRQHTKYACLDGKMRRCDGATGNFVKLGTNADIDDFCNGKGCVNTTDNAQCNSVSAVNGVCGSSKNTCTTGTLSDTTDSSTYYKWDCLGSGGGTTANCTKAKPTTTSADVCGTDAQTIGGVCKTYSDYTVGHDCVVNGSNLSGTIVGSKCQSSSSSSYRCCVPKSQCNGNKLLTFNYSGLSFTETDCSATGGTCVVSGSTASCVSTTTTCTDSNGIVHQSGDPNFCEGNVLKGCANGQINTVVDCATSSQICSGGTCVVVNTATPKLSFRVAFAGVTPNATCLDNFKTVSLTVGKIGTDVKQDLTVDVSKISGSTSGSGYQVFGVDNVDLDSALAGSTNTYVKVKGSLHAKMYYCKNGQTSKSLSQVCDIAIDGSVNNLYNYPILPGDINQDGVVNSIDFSLVKSNLLETGCGNDGDLNGDGIVNNLDTQLIKNSLSYKDDE
ncbi:MAG: dockerin type I domain-containing protein [Candidatus Shapirobacteria bacterium]|nr:dockerin type I domain-containing protein [Candidatus Shapirobacteria bacterium]